MAEAVVAALADTNDEVALAAATGLTRRDTLVDEAVPGVLHILGGTLPPHTR